MKYRIGVFYSLQRRTRCDDDDRGTGAVSGIDNFFHVVMHLTPTLKKK